MAWSRPGLAAAVVRQGGGDRGRGSWRDASFRPAAADAEAKARGGSSSRTGVVSAAVGAAEAWPLPATVSDPGDGPISSGNSGCLETPLVSSWMSVANSLRASRRRPLDMRSLCDASVVSSSRRRMAACCVLISINQVSGHWRSPGGQWFSCSPSAAFHSKRASRISRTTWSDRSTRRGSMASQTPSEPFVLPASRSLVAAYRGINRPVGPPRIGSAKNHGRCKVRRA